MASTVTTKAIRYERDHRFSRLDGNHQVPHPEYMYRTSPIQRSRLVAIYIQDIPLCPAYLALSPYGGDTDANSAEL